MIDLSTTYMRLKLKNPMAGAKDLAVEHEWSGICVESAGELASEIRLGNEVSVSARVTLNGLAPEDVAVHGLVGVRGEIKNPVIVPMVPSAQDSSGNYLYQGVIQTSARS